MSQTYLAVFISLLVQVLPLAGITIGSDQLTQTIQTLVTVASGLWVLVRRYQNGDINVFGGLKK